MVSPRGLTRRAPRTATGIRTLTRIDPRRLSAHRGSWTPGSAHSRTTSRFGPQRSISSINRSSSSSERHHLTPPNPPAQKGDWGDVLQIPAKWCAPISSSSCGGRSCTPQQYAQSNASFRVRTNVISSHPLGNLPPSYSFDRLSRHPADAARSLSEPASRALPHSRSWCSPPVVPPRLLLRVTISPCLLSPQRIGV